MDYEKEIKKLEAQIKQLKAEAEADREVLPVWVPDGGGKSYYAVDKYVFWYKTSYLLLPLLAVVIFMLLEDAGLINIYEGAPFHSNVSGISGTLVGFELTAVSVLLTMPENRFTNLIKSNPRLSLLYREISVAIFMLLVSMMLALFEGPLKIISYIFIAGIASTAHSAYTILRISYYSWKSK